MGNRAIITLEDQHGRTHPVATYVHWNGGLESVLAFIQFTWEEFDRGRDDLYTFHARLCQVIGNFFPDGLSLYAHPIDEADDVAEGCDNGRWHFKITRDGFTLVSPKADCEAARQHDYWTREHNILTMIRNAMPTRDGDRLPVGGAAPTNGEAVA